MKYPSDEETVRRLNEIGDRCRKAGIKPIKITGVEKGHGTIRFK